MLEFLKDKSQYKTRRALSSVGKEAAFDGREGKHSPFANFLLQILRARGKATGNIVTLSGIYNVLQQASFIDNEQLKIAPHIAKFGDDDPLDEFILIPVDSSEN